MDILIIEPELLFARLTRSILEKQGHHVMMAQDATEACLLMESRDFHLILMEYDLPDSSGCVLCRQIRARQADRYTFIVFFTRRTGKRDLIAALEAGADDFILKPLDPTEMKLRLRKIHRLVRMDDIAYGNAGRDRNSCIYSPAAFRQIFRFCLADARRAQKTGALLVLDLCNIDAIENHIGQKQAHNLIARIAGILDANSRESDVAGHIDAHCLALLAQNTNKESCAPVLEKLSLLLRNIAIAEQFPAAPQLDFTLSAIDIPEQAELALSLLESDCHSDPAADALEETTADNLSG